VQTPLTLPLRPVALDATAGSDALVASSATGEPPGTTGESGESVQSALAEAQRTLATLLSNVPGLAYRCRNDPSRTMEVVSAGCYALTGFDPADLVENHRIAFADLIHPDDRHRISEDIRTAVTRRTPFEFTYRITTAHGFTRRLWERGRGVWSDGGALLALEGFIEDMTARADSDAKLRASEERYRSLSASCPVGIFHADNAGNVTYANPCAQRIWAMPESEIVGVGWTARVHPDDLPALSTTWLEALTAHREYEREYRLLMDDGSTRWVHGRSAPLRDALGTVVGAVGTVEDVTARRSLEEQLRHAQKLEALGQLAGGVAHDFNNLLTVIRASLDLARGSAGEPIALLSELDEIRRAAERGAQLTRQLLAFGRKQLLQPERVDLNEIVSGAEGLLRRVLPEAIAFNVTRTPEPCFVHADPRQLEQVLVNLVVNARDAVEHACPATITVTTGIGRCGDSRGRDAADERTADADWVCLEVSDTGQGIPPDSLPHIFEPFFTTKPLGQGTGLGLSTVDGIISQSGGRVEVQSESGVGTTFRITLPRATCASVEAAAPESPRDALERGTRTVLLVEDEAPLRAVGRRVLERNGYHVVEARHGVEALEQWDGHNGAFDVLVTDIRMPELGGTELAARLRARCPTLAVVFMTGYADGRDITAGTPLARTTLLEKPFTRDSLLRALATVNA